MPRIEKHIMQQMVRKELEVIRSNTYLDSYSFFKSEAKGLLNLFDGATNYLFGLLASATNEELGIRGKAQLKDGLINIVSHL